MLFSRARFLGLMLVLPVVFSRPLDAGQPPKGPKTPNDLTPILKAQVALAEKCYQRAYDGLKQTKRFGNVLVQEVKGPEPAHTWSVRWLQGQRQLSPKHEDQIAALKAHLQRMTDLHERVRQLSIDIMPRHNVDEAEWYRLEAKIWLARAKAKRAKDTSK